MYIAIESIRVEGLCILYKQQWVTVNHSEVIIYVYPKTTYTVQSTVGTGFFFSATHSRYSLIEIITVAAGFYQL